MGHLAVALAPIVLHLRVVVLVSVVKEIMAEATLTLEVMVPVAAEVVLALLVVTVGVLLVVMVVPDYQIA
jgi:hypothetical protein